MYQTFARSSTTPGSYENRGGFQTGLGNPQFTTGETYGIAKESTLHAAARLRGGGIEEHRLVSEVTGEVVTA
eukprot:1539981-Rhodomonas_salina.1